MTTSNFDREIVAALTDLTDARYPDYFDRAVERAVGMRQRPASTFPGRWLPASLVMDLRPPLRLGLISLLILSLLSALLIGGLVAGGWFDKQTVVIVPSPVATATAKPDGEPISPPRSVAMPTQTPNGTSGVSGGRFVATGSLVVARSGHTATLLSNGRVLVAGGAGPSEPHGENYLNSTEIWDPLTGAFSTSGPLAAAPLVSEYSRVDMNAIPLPDGRVLVIPAGCLCDPPITEPTEIWDPATQSAHALTTLEIARYGYAATLLTDGRLMIAGGSPSLVTTSTTAAEIWDPVADSVLPSGPLAVGREGAFSTLLADGSVLVVGGGNGTDGPVTTAEVWDPVTASFRTVPSLEGIGAASSRFGEYELRNFGGAITLSDGRVLFLEESGGRIWDPITDTLADAGSFLEPRRGYTATLLRDGRVLIVGGEGMSSAELWDPLAETFTSAGTMAEARTRHTSTALTDGRVLIVGGYEVGRDFPAGYPHTNAEIWEP